jgi:two-component system chemotaxis response regulator CheB
MTTPLSQKQSHPIRVLIADDSPSIQTIFTAMLSDLPDIWVVGHAANGEEAVRMAVRLQPDLITMDIRMPIMDGLEATRQILLVHPTPIIVVANSVYAADYNIAFHALEAGALTVIEKPCGLVEKNFDMVRDQLISTVRTMAGVKVLSRNEAAFTANSIGPMTAMLQSLSAFPIQVVAIAASTGGPAVLKYIFDNLPRGFSIPIVVVQHIMEAFVRGLADWLNLASVVRVRLAVDQERLTPGKVLIAPGGAHLHLAPGGVLRLISSPPVNGHRPSANILFNSVAQAFGKKAVGIILTGMGDDGVEGLQTLGRTGAHIIAQDQESSTVFGMPKMAIEQGTVDEILSPAGIVARLTKLHTHSLSINK